MLLLYEGNTIMNTRQAQYILTIAEEGSITAAARRLNVSQPSLSQMIRQIEKETGVELFDRTVYPIKLTFAGEKYAECARTMVNASEKLEIQLQDIRDENSGRLRLGISVQRGMTILPLVLPRFRRQYPNVSLEVTEAGSAWMEQLLLGGDIDLALAAIDMVSPRINYSLIEEEIIGILSSKYAKIARRVENGTPIRLEDVAGESFVSLKPGHSIRLVQDYLFRKYAMEPHILLETDSLEVARRVTMACGACMLCSDVFYVDRTKENAMFYPLEDYRNSRHFYACTRKNERLPRYMMDFVQYVRDTLKGKETL